jgi:hypothetical protein
VTIHCVAAALCKARVAADVVVAYHCMRGELMNATPHHAVGAGKGSVRHPESSILADARRVPATSLRPALSHEPGAHVLLTGTEALGKRG